MLSVSCTVGNWGYNTLHVVTTVQYDLLVSFPVLHYCYCSLSASSTARTASDITHVAVVEVRIAVMKDCLA